LSRDTYTVDTLRQNGSYVELLLPASARDHGNRGWPKNKATIKLSKHRIES